MRRWPAYTINDVADLTPEQILWHLETGHDPDTLTFGSMEEYERWALKTK